MKLLSKFGFTVAWLTFLAGLMLHASARAETNKGTLTLKAVVRVSTDEVTLRDVVSDGGTELQEKVVICRTPDTGVVRTVSMADISAMLKRLDVAYLLRGPEQISILRISKKLSAADLLPLIEAALDAQKISVQIHEVQLQADIFVKNISSIKLRKLKFDPIIHQYRAQFVIADAPHAAPFEAVAVLDHGIAPLEIKLGKADALASGSALLVRRGEIAAMLVDGSGFSATISVLCLESGPVEKVIRVREQATKHVYRAQVLAHGQLHAVSREN